MHVSIFIRIFKYFHFCFKILKQCSILHFGFLKFDIIIFKGFFNTIFRWLTLADQGWERESLLVTVWHEWHWHDHRHAGPGTRDLILPTQRSAKQKSLICWEFCQKLCCQQSWDWDQWPGTGEVGCCNPMLLIYTRICQVTTRGHYHNTWTLDTNTLSVLPDN